MTDLTVRQYVEQRRWDAYDPEPDDHVRGQEAAYRDILNFIDGNYRVDFLEMVADRYATRQRVGPR
jgi:hypothetical protein